MTPQEKWRAIPGYEGRYEVSDHGQVRSLIRSRLMQPAPDTWGYLKVNLRKDGRATYWRVHNLVLLTFVGPRPPAHVGRHLDGNPQNNRLDNLAYGSQSENNSDQVRHGTHANASKTTCPRRHAYDYVRPNGERSCRTCKNARRRVGA